jgi:hypothetical protein
MRLNGITKPLIKKNKATGKCPKNPDGKIKSATLVNQYGCGSKFGAPIILFIDGRVQNVWQRCPTTTNKAAIPLREWAKPIFECDCVDCILLSTRSCARAEAISADTKFP